MLKIDNELLEKVIKIYSEKYLSDVEDENFKQHELYDVTNVMKVLLILQQIQEEQSTN